MSQRAMPLIALQVETCARSQGAMPCVSIRDGRGVAMTGAVSGMPLARLRNQARRLVQIPYGQAVLSLWRLLTSRPNLTQHVTFITVTRNSKADSRRMCQEFPSFLVSLLRVSRRCSEHRHSGFLAPQQTKKFRDGHQFRDDVPDSRQKF